MRERERQTNRERQRVREVQRGLVKIFREQGTEKNLNRKMTER